jgi:hypothetical protein
MEYSNRSLGRKGGWYCRPRYTENALRANGLGFCYLFPLSFFLSMFVMAHLGDRMASLVIPTALSTGLLGITELFQAFGFIRGIDLSVIGYGIGAASIGSLSGAVFTRDEESMDIGGRET